MIALFRALYLSPRTAQAKARRTLGVPLSSLLQIQGVKRNVFGAELNADADAPSGCDFLAASPMDALLETGGRGSHAVIKSETR